ncbi:MAG: hypothetical protein AAF598_21830, partial [Bacteroidota bacterium]
EILDAAKSKGLKIFPLISHYSAYNNSKLGRFQSFNKPNEPLESINKDGQSGKVLMDLANEIAKLYKRQ